MRACHGNRFVRASLAALVATLLAAGCGGVDSGGTGAVAVGPITGYGSIIVNGVRFDETAASIRDDDGTLLASDRLALGAITQVDGAELNRSAGTLRATATSIRVSSDLIGPVAGIDAIAGSFTVLEQTVQVTPATVFDATFAGGLTSISAGATVEVYGRYDAARAHYTATRIEARPNPAFYKVRGPITSVDRARRILGLGPLAVDYSAIPTGDDDNVRTGTIVRAKLQPAPVSGTWIAVALPSGVLPLPDGEAARIEGRISSFTSSRMFSVDGTLVDASAARFPNGTAGLGLGARVSIEGGSFMGMLYAQVVSFEGEETGSNSRFELHGTIEAIDAAAKTFTLRGTTVDYSGSVRFEGGSAADLAVGRRVEVNGTLSSNGITITAQEIEFD
jgi:Domain of unknown function (DUF5666)